MDPESIRRIIAISLIYCSHFCEGKNVLILVADDLGQEIGYLGNSQIKTPHMDSLAKESVVFTNAYTTVSSCSPSRSAILTGLPVHQNGMYGLHHSVHHFNSHEKVRSLPAILAKKKIKTGIIGKKHVGPPSVYPFHFEQTEENNPINSVGRNISHIKELTAQFLQSAEGHPFLLYVGFHDPHRCGHTQPQLGNFCEKYGSGEPGTGTIPDWTPVRYRPEEVVVPPYLPDTPATRTDIAAQYTTISRLDQGVGLVISELRKTGRLNDTLIIFTSDNGIPFPLGRTNLYLGGVNQPLFIKAPEVQAARGMKVNFQVSLLDIVPTVLDWFDIQYPSYSIFKKDGKVELTGKSLLPFVHQPGSQTDSEVYGSQILHEVTMYYPMRSVRTNRYTLIHNLNYWAPFPIDQDGYLAPTFLDILNRTKNKEPLPWAINLHQYYFRKEWELFDRQLDPSELYSVAEKSSYKYILSKLKEKLYNWMLRTKDPWLCSPHGVLEEIGDNKTTTCMPLYN